MPQEKFTTPAYQESAPAPLLNGANFALHLGNPHLKSPQEGHAFAQTSERDRQHSQERPPTREELVATHGLMSVRNRREEADSSTPKLGFETSYQMTE